MIKSYFVILINYEYFIFKYMVSIFRFFQVIFYTFVKSESNLFVLIFIHVRKTIGLKDVVII